MINFRFKFLLIVFDLLVAAVGVFGLVAYDFYQHSRLAQIAISSQNNNLVSENLGAAATSFSSLKPFFTRITFVEPNSKFRLLDENEEKLQIPIFIRKPISHSSDHVEQSYVEFEFNCILNIITGLVFSIFIAGIFNALLIYLVRSKEQQDQLKLQAQIHERFFEIALHVAHDIRSPLSVLNAFSQRSTFEPEHITLLGAVAKRINGIADDLLEKARITKSVNDGFDPLQPLGILIEEKNLLVSNRGRITLQSMFSEKLFAFGHSHTFLRIISNLIDNSIQAVDPQKPFLAIALTAEKRNGLIEISINDNGVGIDPADLPRVGTRGFSKKIDTGGNGIGLWNAIETIKSWGGTIEISSEKSVGTSMKIKLRIIGDRRM